MYCSADFSSLLWFSLLATILLLAAVLLSLVFTSVLQCFAFSYCPAGVALRNCLALFSF